MAINIKNERVVELAREASRLTGQTQTGAIERALRELVERQQAGSAVSRTDLVWQTLGMVDARLDEGRRSDMRRAMDEMYDEQGLPA